MPGRLLVRECAHISSKPRGLSGLVSRLNSVLEYDVCIIGRGDGFG